MGPFLPTRKCPIKPKKCFLAPTRASPCEKSEEKGWRQKVIFLRLNMIDIKSTGNESTFCPHFFSCWALFWPFWVWAKKCLFFHSQISTFYLGTLKSQDFENVSILQIYGAHKKFRSMTKNSDFSQTKQVFFLSFLYKIEF